MHTDRRATRAAAVLAQGTIANQSDQLRRVSSLLRQKGPIHKFLVWIHDVFTNRHSIASPCHGQFTRYRPCNRTQQPTDSLTGRETSSRVGKAHSLTTGNTNTGPQGSVRSVWRRLWQRSKGSLQGTRAVEVSTSRTRNRYGLGPSCRETREPH